MDQEQINKQILDQLAKHEVRLKTLESTDSASIINSGLSKKAKTLRELVNSRKFKSGQEELTVIVGYNEKIVGKPIAKKSLKEEWSKAKMPGKYDGKFLERAKDIFFTIKSDHACILTQTGEDFFEEFIKNEPSKPTSK